MMVGREMGHTHMSGGEKTNNFIVGAFSLETTEKIRCPCVKCQNARCFDKALLTKHLVRNGFTLDYET
jgi:hypothetical protein